MLTARAGGTEHVHLDILGTNLHLHAVVQLRNDLNGGKRGVPSAGSVKGGDAHQTVHARLTFQIAIGVFADDLDGSAFESRVVAVKIVENFILEAVRFRPVRIHTVQHLRPVLRLGAACTRVEGHDGVLAVIFAGQQRCQTLLVDGMADLVDRLGALFKNREILCLVRKLNERQGIVIVGTQRVIAVDLALDDGGVLTDLLCLVHVVPKAGSSRLRVQLGGLALQLCKPDGTGKLFNFRLHALKPQPQFFKL